ncbi:TAKT protein, partial [Acromyrmex heyeri]
MLAHIHPYLVKGIPELDLPPIEPLVIPELKMENGQGPVRVRAIFTNITTIGPGNYSINKVRVNISSYRFDMHLSLPKIDIHGSYDINGNVLLFPIQSDVKAIVRIQGVEEVKNGISYMKISRLLIDFSLGRARLRINDHLNGNNVIGQAMNQFLNQNIKEIIDEMRPAASSSIAKYFKDFLNAIFIKMPLKVWMHDT